LKSRCVSSGFRLSNAYVGAANGRPKTTSYLLGSYSGRSMIAPTVSSGTYPKRCFSSGNEVFKNGNPALRYGGVVFFPGFQSPGDGLAFPQLFAELHTDGIVPVGKFVGHKIRHAQEVGQTVPQGEFQSIRQIALALEEILRQLPPDDVGGFLYSQVTHRGSKDSRQ